jgi:urease accessory protein
MNSPLDPTLIEAGAAVNSSSWQARLSLSFAQRSRGVRLVKCEHEGPLYVQKAFYPEGPNCAHVYLLHPPGGLVTGDTLTISIEAQKNSHALITTPGAGRVYKARDAKGVQTQNLQINVQENAIVEWFPLETILFPSAQARMKTRVDLSDNANFIGWEVTCLGLPANQITFDSGSVSQSMQIWRNGRILLNESLVIDDIVIEGKERASSATQKNSSLLNGNAGLRNLPVHGFMIGGPFKDEPLDLLESLRLLQTQTAKNELLAASHNGEFITVRYLGACTEKARKSFTQAWALIRPELIQKQAVAPRIWAT